MEIFDSFLPISDCRFRVYPKPTHFRLDFIKGIIGKNYYWQSYKIQDYITSLRDYAFWQSSEIYLENMKKFVSQECSASDFASTVYFLIRNDIKESECLILFVKANSIEIIQRIFLLNCQ